MATVKITTKAGDRLPHDTALFPGNNMLYNLIRSLRVLINNQPVVSLHNYPLYAYFDTKLSANQLDLDTHLKKQLYIPDTPGAYDSVDKANAGGMERREYFGNTVKIQDPEHPNDTTKKIDQFQWSKEPITLIGVLKLPIPDVNYLPHPSNVIIDMERNSDDFVLTSSNEYKDVKVTIDNIELRVLNFTLNENLYNSITERLNKESLKYYFQKPDIDIFTVSAGSKERIIDNIGVGKVPSQILIAVQETSVFEGDLQRNSLRFPRIFSNALGDKSASLDSVKLQVGQQQIDGLEMTNPDQLYGLPYFKYFVLNGALCGGRTLPPKISPMEFLEDTHFYMFDMTCSLLQSPSYAKSPIKSGYMRLFLNFSHAVPVPLTIIAVVISDACVILNAGGKVTLESS